MTEKTSPAWLPTIVVHAVLLAFLLAVYLFVIPRYVAGFAAAGTALPWLTKFFVSVSMTCVARAVVVVPGCFLLLLLDALVYRHLVTTASKWTKHWGWGWTIVLVVELLAAVLSMLLVGG